MYPENVVAFGAIHSSISWDQILGTHSGDTLCNSWDQFLGYTLRPRLRPRFSFLGSVLGTHSWDSFRYLLKLCF